VSDVSTDPTEGPLQGAKFTVEWVAKRKFPLLSVNNAQSSLKRLSLALTN